MVYRRYGKRSIRKASYRKRSYRPYRRSYRSRQSRRSKYASFTSQRGTGTVGVRYKSRRIGRSRFNHTLWTATLTKNHYRSYQTVVSNANTNASASLMQLSFIDPFTNGSFFWTSAGGCQPDSAGGTVPLFDSTIILRGGKWQVAYTNTSSDVIKVSVWYVYTIGRPDTSILPTTAGSGWDPSVIPDFYYKYGKIFRQEQVLLSPSQSWNTERRLGIKKIDMSDFTSLIGHTPVIILGLENMSQSVSATGFIKHTLNVSFAADAIGGV